MILQRKKQIYIEENYAYMETGSIKFRIVVSKVSLFVGIPVHKKVNLSIRKLEKVWIKKSSVNNMYFNLHKCDSPSIHPEQG